MKPEVQSWYDAYKGKPRLEILEFQRRWTENAPQYKACAVILDEMNEDDRLQDLREAGQRHMESISETRASRRLDAWAFGIAVISLLVGGAGLWRSFLPAEPAHLLPAPAYLAPVDHVDPIPGSAPKIATPATKPMLPQPIPSPHEKPKALPTPPTE